MNKRITWLVRWRAKRKINALRKDAELAYYARCAGRPLLKFESRLTRLGIIAGLLPANYRATNPPTP